MWLEQRARDVMEMKWAREEAGNVACIPTVPPDWRLRRCDWSRRLVHGGVSWGGDRALPGSGPRREGGP